EALGSCNRDLVHGLAAVFLLRILSATSRIVGGLHKLEQPANSVSWTFSSFAQPNNLLSRSVGSLHKLEQPANSIVSTFFSSTRSNHKNHWISDNSAVSGIKARMHAGRTRNRRSHYWPNRPLRPIGGETSEGGPTDECDQRQLGVEDL